MTSLTSSRVDLRVDGFLEDKERRFRVLELG